MLKYHSKMNKILRTPKDKIAIYILTFCLKNVINNNITLYKIFYVYSKTSDVL